jgi:dTDP-4-dehydrorhamnose reductase
LRKIFIVGASGFIGNYLFKSFANGGWITKGSYYQYFEDGLSKIDITNKAEIARALVKELPEVVCLPAANPNVEYCQEHPEETEKVNVEGAMNVALICKEIGAKLVYFSSDYIFDGTSGPYAEEDLPNPICVYGKQKLSSENIIREMLDNYLIARTTIVYGWEKRGKNFLERLLQSLNSRKEIGVPVDQVGSPTYVENLIDMLFALVEKNAAGIFNVCGKDHISRYAFACKAAEIFGLDASYLKPVTTEKLGQKAPRPLKAGMKTDKIEDAIHIKPIGVIDGLIKMRERKCA